MHAQPRGRTPATALCEPDLAGRDRPAVFPVGNHLVLRTSVTSHDPYCLTPWGDEEVSGRPGDRRATTQAGSRVPARLRQRAVVSPRTRQAGVGDARERPRLVRDLHQPAELAGDPSAASPEATVTRFVGRRAELREISARAAAAAAGTRQTVVIEGRPW